MTSSGIGLEPVTAVHETLHRGAIVTRVVPTLAHRAAAGISFESMLTRHGALDVGTNEFLVALTYIAPFVIFLEAMLTVHRA